jgi:hypothetical protein
MEISDFAEQLSHAEKCGLRKVDILFLVAAEVEIIRPLPKAGLWADKDPTPPWEWRHGRKPLLV